MLGLHYLVGHYIVVMAGQSGKRKECYRSLAKETSGSVQIGLKFRRRISKGKRDIQKDQNLPQLSARKIFQRSKEALLARAVRVIEILGSQSHKGLSHRAEQMK